MISATEPGSRKSDAGFRPFGPALLGIVVGAFGVLMSPTPIADVGSSRLRYERRRHRTRCRIAGQREDLVETLQQALREQRRRFAPTLGRSGR